MTDTTRTVAIVKLWEIQSFKGTVECVLYLDEWANSSKGSSIGVRLEDIIVSGEIIATSKENFWLVNRPTTVWYVKLTRKHD